MALILSVQLVPLFLLGAVWILFRKEGSALPSWRRIVFVTAIVANAVSAILLLAIFIRAQVAMRTLKPVDPDRIFPVISMMGFALLAAMTAMLGRRLSRIVLVGSGLLTLILWYLAALAASP
jgi:hypothetical protein